MRTVDIKELFLDSFSLRNDTASHEVIKERMIEGGKVRGSNMGILMLAILIASIGLNMNSTAVIIGAMLISPLMGSIQAAAYGIASSDVKLIRKSLVGLLFQVVMSLLVSTIYFKVSPISTATSELLARTQPTVWDVLIAFCGGLAGIIGITRVEKSNVIPGVAIATALMPPLCTCGYALATAQWSYFFGAGYLFCVNTYFILFASTLILTALNVPKKRRAELTEDQFKDLRKRLAINTLVVIIPSLLVAYNMVQKADEDEAAVIGFENAGMSVEQLSDELMVLYPEVERVSLKRVETVVPAEEGSLSVEEDSHKKPEVVDSIELELAVSESLSRDDARQMKKWVEHIYNKQVMITETLIKYKDTPLSDVNRPLSSRPGK